MIDYDQKCPGTLYRYPDCIPIFFLKKKPKNIFLKKEKRKPNQHFVWTLSVWIGLTEPCWEGIGGRIRNHIHIHLQLNHKTKLLFNVRNVFPKVRSNCRCHHWDREDSWWCGVFLMSINRIIVTHMPYPPSQSVYLLGTQKKMMVWNSWFLVQLNSSHQCCMIANARDPRLGSSSW